MRALVLVAVLAHAAHAESPVNISAGLGVGIGKLDLSSPEGSPHLGVGAHVDVLCRVLQELDLGMHVAISRVPYSTYHYEPDQTPQENYDSFIFHAIAVGITAHYTIDDRVWLAPWIGLERGKVPNDPLYDRNSIAYGIEAGADLSRNGKQRIGAFASLSHSHFDTPAGNFQSFTIALAGIAYRYR